MTAEKDFNPLDDYRICMIVQLAYKETEDVLQVLDFRNEMGDKIEKRLQKEKLGFYDGGDIGGGRVNIFFYVNDANQSFVIMKEVLESSDDVSKRNLKIVSLENDKMDVLYPEGGTFSVFKEL